MIRFHVLITLMVGWNSLASAHVLENFRWLDVARTVAISSTSVTISYDCDLKVSASKRPPAQIDSDGDGKVSEDEARSFMVATRDYLVADLAVLQGSEMLKVVPMEQGEGDPDGRMRAVLTAELSQQRDTTDSVLTIIDPAFLLAQIDSGEAVPSTLVRAGDGVHLLTERGEETVETQIASTASNRIRVRRDSPVLLAVAEVASSPAFVEESGDGRLRAAIGAQSLSPWMVIGSLVVAMFLGAVHALTPGHGKTIVAAYLVGTKGRIRDAVYLGLIVTFAHSLSVFLLGAVALAASRYVMQQTLANYLGLVSGLLVLGFGLALLFGRLRRSGSMASVLPVEEHPHEHALGGEPHVHHEHEHTHPSGGRSNLVHAHAHLHLGTEKHGPAAEHVHSHAESAMAHSHDHGSGSSSHHTHEDGHSHDHKVEHSHGGSPHVHTVPGELTKRGLLALGIAGGMVPCTDAIVVLLIAVAVGRILFGLAIIAAFSMGLAAVLIGIGMIMITSRPLVERLAGGAASRVMQVYLPIGSAILVTLLGFGIVVRVLMTMGIVSVHI